MITIRPYQHILSFIAVVFTLMLTHVVHAQKINTTEYIDTKILLSQEMAPFVGINILDVLNSGLKKAIQPFSFNKKDTFLLPVKTFYCGGLTSLNARIVDRLCKSITLFDTLGSVTKLARVERRYPDPKNKDSLLVDSICVLLFPGNKRLAFCNSKKPDGVSFLDIYLEDNYLLFNYPGDNIKVVETKKSLQTLLFHSDTILKAAYGTIQWYKKVKGFIKDSLKYSELYMVENYDADLNKEYDHEHFILSYKDYKVTTIKQLVIGSRKRRIHCNQYTINHNSKEYRLYTNLYFGRSKKRKSFKSQMGRYFPKIEFSKEMETIHEYKPEPSLPDDNEHESRNFILTEDDKICSLFDLSINSTRIVPYYDSIARALGLMKLKDSDWDDGRLLIPDTMIEGVAVVKLGRNYMENYGDSTWKPDKYYIACFNEFVFRKLVKQERSLKLNKQELEAYKEFAWGRLNGNFMIFNKTDSGFILFDYLYKNKVADNPMNVKFIEELEFPNQAKEKTNKNERILIYANMPYRLKRYRYKSENLWLCTSNEYQKSPFINDSVLLKEGKALTRAQKRRTYWSQPGYSILAFKTKDYGWAHEYTKTRRSKTPKGYFFYPLRMDDGWGNSHYPTYIVKKTDSLTVEINFRKTNVFIDSTKRNFYSRTTIYQLNDSMQIVAVKDMKAKNNGDNFTWGNIQFGFNDRLFINNKLYTGNLVYLLVPQPYFIMRESDIMPGFKGLSVYLNAQILDTLSDYLKQTFHDYLLLDKKHLVYVSNVQSQSHQIELFRYDSINVVAIRSNVVLSNYSFAGGMLLFNKAYNLRGEEIFSVIQSGDTTETVIRNNINSGGEKISNKNFMAFYYKNDSIVIDTSSLYMNSRGLNQLITKKIISDSLNTEIFLRYDEYAQLSGKFSKTYNKYSEQSVLSTFRFDSKGKMDSAILYVGKSKNRQYYLRGSFLFSKRNSRAMKASERTAKVFCRVNLPDDKSEFECFVFAQSGDTIESTTGSLTELDKKDIVNTLYNHAVSNGEYFFGYSALDRINSEKIWYNNRMLVHFNMNVDLPFSIVNGSYKNGRNYINLDKTAYCIDCDSSQIWVDGKPIYRKYSTVKHTYWLRYSNGRLMGLSKPNRTMDRTVLQLHCDDSIPFLRANLQFSEFFDSLGNKTFDGKNGYVKLLDSKGQLVYEAFYKHGQHDSIYKGYSINGVLNEIGKYKNGARDGLWYFGNLNGKFDWSGLCNASPEYIKSIMANEPYVNLQIVEYNNGVQVNTYNINYKKIE